MTTKPEVATIKLIFLYLKVNFRPFITYLSQNSTNGLCLSLTFFFNNRCDITGTKVNVKINAPSKAKPNVNANGENILPSTFWKEKIGKRDVMIINFEKKIAFPSPVPVCFIQPAFAILLKRSIPYFFALWSSITNNPSTITTAPSMIIPKSTAPNDKRLALIPAILRQKKANKKDNGMMMETIKVVRQSAIKIKTITVTKMIPSSKLCITVLVVKSIRF